MSIENCKLKQYCDISPYVLDWPKSMIWTTSNAGEDAEKLDGSYVTCANTKK